MLKKYNYKTIMFNLVGTQLSSVCLLIAAIYKDVTLNKDIVALNERILLHFYTTLNKVLKLCKQVGVYTSMLLQHTLKGLFLHAEKEKRNQFWTIFKNFLSIVNITYFILMGLSSHQMIIFSVFAGLLIILLLEFMFISTHGFVKLLSNYK